MNIGEKRKKQAFLAVAVLVLLVIGGRYVFSRQAAVAKKNLLPTVAVASVQQADLVKKISLVGQTVPQSQVDIAAK